MPTMTRRRVLFVIVSTLALSPLVVRAGVKIKVEHDKTFPFASVRTWAWHPDGAGTFKMALTADDDSAPVKARFAPVVEQAITDELTQRQLVHAPSAPPDLYVRYFALISAGTQSQTVGQFYPATLEWGLPPFPPSTTAFRVIEQGSLVIDLISPAEKSTVWRGVAQAELQRERPDAERDRRLREAVRDMLRKYPSKQK